MRELRLFVVLFGVCAGWIAWGQDPQTTVPEKPLTEKPKVSDKKVKDPDTLEAVTFADTKGGVYLDLHELAGAFALELSYDKATKVTTLGGVEVDRTKLRQLYDGSSLLPIEELTKYQIAMAKTEEGKIILDNGSQAKTVVIPPKAVEISVSRQTLRAWQGDRLVMKTHISSGRPGHDSPLGNFKTGGKFPMKLSTLYDNAEMPFAVQVIGDVFVHGYASVPHNPASHGCIRMPLKPENAARYFFNWVDQGVSVRILKDWTDAARELILMEPGGEEELATQGHVKNIKSGSPYGDHKPKPPKKPAAAPPKVFGPPITLKGGGK
ncbi:MAG: L,D-transpeptidase [Armatimonadetes bacterium]|nr:L,D-transpeptidase [Armatimonadota bacterium]